jgi:hypothetical protein
MQAFEISEKKKDGSYTIGVWHIYNKWDKATYQIDVRADGSAWPEWSDLSNNQTLKNLPIHIHQEISTYFQNNIWYYTYSPSPQDDRLPSCLPAFIAIPIGWFSSISGIKAT